ncbi:hypothetical protein J1N35_026322 [Gossypium stocksii]|uniref:Uncharacterized protein n=1 Tax=Gossypium stocksii TaxID=47602 RepID=A0A9D3V7S1_9ROSI|nr:hypothetical protein J1N35_026322 [Gossypium stocksii]
MGPSSAPTQEPTSMAIPPLINMSHLIQLRILTLSFSHKHHIFHHIFFFYFDVRFCFWTFVPGILHTDVIDIFSDDDTDDDVFSVYNLGTN